MWMHGGKIPDRCRSVPPKRLRPQPDRPPKELHSLKRAASAALFVDGASSAILSRTRLGKMDGSAAIGEMFMLVRGMAVVLALAITATAGQAQAPAERGKYLVNTIMTCQNCHTPKGERGAPIYERDLSSGLSWDEPPFKVTASNITQDKETGIGSWTDEQIKTALRKGQRPNGVHLAAV